MEPLPFDIEAFGVTDVGLVREKNEDVWAECPEDSFFVLADGMGGHQAGDVAAKAAVNGLCAVLKDSIEHSSTALNVENASRSLKLAIQEVNRILHRMSQQDHLLKGMGTTLLCLHILPKHAILAHVGDSRIYRFRNGGLTQLTEDHSLLRELIDMGQIHAGQASTFEYKNILTRAVGTESTIEPTVQQFPIEEGDTFLLCSDGLTDQLTDPLIEEILIDNENLEQAGKILVKKAKVKGGHDNITLILVRIGPWKSST